MLPRVLRLQTVTCECVVASAKLTAIIEVIKSFNIAIQEVIDKHKLHEFTIKF